MHLLNQSTMPLIECQISALIENSADIWYIDMCKELTIVPQQTDVFTS